MTYEQAQELFEEMDNLERNAELLQYEMDKDEPDFNAMNRYKSEIQVQSKRIYNALDKSNDT